jgi:hypothetical protein
MPSRKVALGAVLTVVAVVVGAGTVANIVMPPPAPSERAMMVTPAPEAKPAPAAKPAAQTKSAPRPTQDTAKRLTEGGPTNPGADKARLAAKPAIAAAPEKPAKVTVSETAAPAQNTEPSPARPSVAAPAANAAFPPVQPLDSPAVTTPTPAAKPVAPTATAQRPKPSSAPRAPAAERQGAPKRTAESQRPRPSTRPEPYAMRDFLRLHFN